MEYINILLTYPILIFVLPFFFIVSNWDKIRSIFPDAQQKMVRLELSKRHLNKKDKYLKRFLKLEIKKTNFRCATGLFLNNKNIELIKFYNKHSESLSWSEIKQIQGLISKSEAFVPVFYGKQKFIIFIKTILWAILSLFGMIEFGKIYYKVINQEISKNYLDDICGSLFIMVFSYVMFYIWKEKISILIKYDKLFKKNLITSQDV